MAESILETAPRQNTAKISEKELLLQELVIAIQESVSLNNGLVSQEYVPGLKEVLIVNLAGTIYAQVRRRLICVLRQDDELRNSIVSRGFNEVHIRGGGAPKSIIFSEYNHEVEEKVN